MTTLHEKMLSAIDAYFSAANRDEEMEAEDLLLDVRDEIRNQPARTAPTIAEQVDRLGELHAVIAKAQGETK